MFNMITKTIWSSDDDQDGIWSDQSNTCVGEEWRGCNFDVFAYVFAMSTTMPYLFAAAAKKPRKLLTTTARQCVSYVIVTVTPTQSALEETVKRQQAIATTTAVA